MERTEATNEVEELRATLTRRTQQLAEAQALTHSGSWDWDIAADTVTWSDELYRIFGVEPGAFGATLAAYLDRVHPDDRERVRVSIERAVTEDEPFDHRARIVRSDGEVRILHSRGRRRTDADGRAAVLYGTCRDVTDEEQLREHVLRMQRMDAVGRLAGGIAHDFNNLLTVILSYTQLLRRHLDDRARVGDGLAEIQGAAESAAAMTRQLLTFARGDVAAPAVTDVAAAVRGCERLLRRLIGEDVTLTVELVEPLGRVPASASQLEQILLNLASNARDAMLDGGRLTVRAGRRSVGAAGRGALRPGEYVVLEVEDTGSGMTPEVAERALEPFFTTKPAGQGTGLGLSTIFGIARQLGGDVELTTAPGRGTTVAVWLPRTEAAEVAPAAPAPATPRAGRARVLVVEDEPRLRALIERMLDAAGYEVEVAATADAALARLDAAAAAPAILVVDVVLPGISGVELAARFRARHPGLPVVYMSGYPRTQHRVAEVPLDARSHFLPKPFTVDALVATIESAVAAAA